MARWRRGKLSELCRRHNISQTTFYAAFLLGSLADAGLVASAGIPPPAVLVAIDVVIGQVKVAIVLSYVSPEHVIGCSLQHHNTVLAVIGGGVVHQEGGTA